MSNNRAFFNNFKSLPFKDTPLRSSGGASEIILLSINLTGTRLINSRTDKSIRIWKCFPDKLADPVVVEQPHAKAVESVSWHPKHEFTFVTVGRDDLFKVWKIAGNSCLLEREIKVVKLGSGAKDSICQIVRYSNDGELLAVVDRDSTVSLYSTSSYTKIHQFQVNEHVYAFEWFNKDHDYFILGLHDGTAPVYKVVDGGSGNDEFAVVDLLHTIRGHRSSITAISVDPRGKYFVIGSNEGVASIWSTSSMLNINAITSIDESVASIDISRDGTYIAITFDSGSNARIFESLSVEEIYEVEHSSSGKLVLSTFKWFPNKTGFVFATEDGKVMGYLKK